MSRPVLGIDLGTTHCALAHSAGGAIHVDEIPQLVAPGEVAARTLLPSALYLPGPELHASALRLPWGDGGGRVVGELARIQGAAVPSRLVTSAKSWLGHARVDRLAPILPWGIEEPDLQKVSPVAASTAYLSHLAAAFTAQTGIDIDRADVILGVPASFDEVARQLTLRAAQEAGLSPTLLEEPQAAFYAWLSDHAARWKEHLSVGDTVLVCDIGGGTTDFSLLRVAGEEDGRPVLERTAVGDHLLLGGDNMDLALARRAESRMRREGRLDPAPFAALTQACRLAKEHLLDDPADGQARASWTVTIAGRGSRLIGGSLHDEITRAEAEALLLDGFFPRVAADAAPARRGALQEFGLPYAADAGITRHLAAFLRTHRAKPTRLLWNGGVTKSPAVRARLLEVMNGWLDQPIVELPGAAPDLGVARGAAYYGLARRGEGVRIGGGSARAYYVALETAQVTPGQLTVLCVAPRGMMEGERAAVDGHPLEVVTNKPVRFRLFASMDRRDAAGQLLTVSADDLTEQAPLHTVLRFPRSSQDVALQVSLEAHLSELGALELDCVARSTGNEADRWRLAFDLRAPAEDRRAEPRSETAARSEAPAALAMAIEVIRGVYGSGSDDRFTSIQPAMIMKALTAPLGPKDSWTPTTLRALWEPLKDLRGGRGKSAAHEARWMNLCGYTLRPGFGYALDDWRVKETWRLFNAGLVHEKDAPCRLEWWVMWRRISGGLTRTQQDEVWKRLQPYVAPKAKVERRPVAKQELAEMWRTVASMERLPQKVKSELGDLLIGDLEKKEAPEHALWALGRLGARVPLYGTIDEVVPAKKAQRWLERLMALGWKGDSEAFAAAELGRMSGDRARDLEEPLRKKLAERLRQNSDGERLARLVLEPTAREAREERLAFGDALPLGLRLSAPDVMPI
ncbi:MAG: Hsp70 family protein [Polyangia bacterium]